MRRARLVLWFIILILVSNVLPSAHAQQWSGIISPNRAINWSSVGVAGGIPNRTTSCANLTSSATIAQINSAIAACPAGQVVNLGAGTYNLTSGLVWNSKSNVTVRGAGANQTFLVFSGADPCRGQGSLICFESADTNYAGGPTNVANWTAGYARGTTVITLSSTSNLAVGNPIMLDQLDDTTDSGDIYECTTAACATDGAGGGARSGRGMQQIVTVTAINGNQVTISPALYDWNWRSSQTPQAWWATSPVSGNGIENVSIDNTSVGTGSTANIQFFNCQNCWVKGVRSIMANRSHVMLFQANRITVRDSYFFESVNHASVSYGVESLPASDSLIENNIFQRVTANEVMTGTCEGCVFGYNFGMNQTYTASNTWQNQSGFMHATGDQWILFEGEVNTGDYSDNFHGTHQFQTFFRNRYDGFEKNGATTTNSNTIPLILLAYSRFYNVIGNVLGTSGYHNQYEYTIGTGGAPDRSIYETGVGDQVANDINVTRTLMRWGNYDTVNAAVRFVNSEVPSGITNFANPVPSSHTLPASFYLSAKPSWWPAAKPWPPIGPDVTGGNIPNVAGYAHTIPAQDCYAGAGGSADGSGSVLAFNAGNCYGSAAVTRPASPTNLKAGVN